MANKRNVWEGAPYREEQESSGEPHPLSKKFRRLLMQAKADEPSFFCPKCKLRFKVEFGTWAHERFKETTFYCKDCIQEHPEIQRR